MVQSQYSPTSPSSGFLVAVVTMTPELELAAEMLGATGGQDTAALAQLVHTLLQQSRQVPCYCYSLDIFCCQGQQRFNNLISLLNPTQTRKSRYRDSKPLLEVTRVKKKEFVVVEKRN